MRRMTLAAAIAATLAMGVVPTITATEAQAATVCKGSVSNSPLKGRGKTSCTGMPKGTYQRAKLWCVGYSQPAYGNWVKNGETSYARCTVAGAEASYVDIQTKKL